MLEAVIFDCFGVLVTDGWLPFKHRYFGSQPELFEQATTANRRVDAGLISYDDFIAEVAQLAGVDKATAHHEIEQNPPNEELFEIIRRELTPKYKLGILSNAGMNWLDRLLTAEQLKLFDASALSFEIGASKPDARAYQAIAERLNVSPEACLFVDDQERYCQAAKDIGMQAIHYQAIDQFSSDLNHLLSASAK